MALISVAKLSQMTSGKGVCVDVQGKKLALFVADGKCFAIDEFCTHRNAPLHEGTCVGAEVVCPYHAARFDLNSGAALNLPATVGVRSYPVTIVGDDVQVEI